MTVKVKKMKAKSKSTDQLDEETIVQMLLKQMLVTRIFAATYVGRFYVESLDVYRDVIQVHKEEKEFVRDLAVVKKRVESFYENAVWTAITGPEDVLAIRLPTDQTSLWVQLREVAFGSYWFMVEDGSISERGEVVIKVKVIRNFEPSNESGKEDISWDFNQAKHNLLNNLQEILTWHNTKESFKFMFLLIMTMVTALLHGLHYLGEYSIKFFREFNRFIHVCTPIFIKLLDLVSKTIGGFYLLVVMLWRGRNAPLPPFPQMSIEGPPAHQRQFRPIMQPPHRKYY